MTKEEWIAAGEVVPTPPSIVVKARPIPVARDSTPTD